MDIQFGYKVKQLPLDSRKPAIEGVADILNGEGDTGWELISVVPDPDNKGFGLFYFKKTYK